MMRFDGKPVKFEYKQCIIVRVDLHLSQGKLAAQAAHAAVSAYDKAKRSIGDSWKAEGQKKVILAVDSLDELFELEEAAKLVGLPIARIEDAGLTEVPPGTITALGIGPAKNEELDKITGYMKLL